MLNRWTFLQARLRAPSLIILDDLDVLAPPEDASEPPGGPPRLPWGELIADMIDTLQPGPPSALQPIAFLATASSASAVAVPLRTAGRLDLALPLPMPPLAAREAFLATASRRGGLLSVASGATAAAAATTDGFDRADLRTLAERTLIAAAGRLLLSPGPIGEAVADIPLEASARGSPQSTSEGETLLAKDFDSGRAGLLPTMMRGSGVATAIAGDEASVGWAAIGGLEEVRSALQARTEITLCCGCGCPRSCGPGPTFSLLCCRKRLSCL